MDHDFDLAFNLLDEAIGRLQEQQYGITRIAHHNHGDAALISTHRYTRRDGHQLTLLAQADYGLRAAVEATAADLETEPHVRITKVRVGDLMFHAVPGTAWTYRARGERTYTLTAGLVGEPAWTLTVSGAATTTYHELDAAIGAVLDTYEGALV